MFVPEAHSLKTSFIRVCTKLLFCSILPSLHYRIIGSEVNQEPVANYND